MEILKAELLWSRSCNYSCSGCNMVRKNIKYNFNQKDWEKGFLNPSSISQDDPEALKKLKEKLLNLEKRQEEMKIINKIVRKKKLTKDQKIEELRKLGITHYSISNIFDTSYGKRIGYSRYSLSNNNANIRRVKQRIEKLEIIKTHKTSELTLNGVKILDNVEDNRLQLFFDDIPEEKVRKDLKSNGFRWSRKNGCWQSYRGRRYIDNAKRIIGGLE